MIEAHDGAIAMNRFGLGARLGETIPSQPKQWLASQLTQQNGGGATFFQAQPDSRTLAMQFAEAQQQVQIARQQGGAINASSVRPVTGEPGMEPNAVRDARKQLNATTREAYRTAVDLRFVNGLTTTTPFVERLVAFWSNHFAISVEKPAVAMLAGSFENEAIRPHVLGRFEDMLLAVERHPAMLLYLDQVSSIGPDSVAAQRATRMHPERHPGLNENLARETMELHTLGARSGYQQQDVTEFARALTGWSMGGLTARALSARDAGNAVAPGEFVFRMPQHEPGTRTIMGRQYDQVGEAQPLAILHDFASAPATAHHVSEKLARHFTADQPPPALVQHLANVFLRSGGDLPSVYRVLIDSPLAWSPVNAKFKTPWDWTLSSYRAMGRTDLGKLQVAPVLSQLGQSVWRPGSPAGFDDIAASWAAPDALVRRVELAQRFAAQWGTHIDARVLGPQIMPGIFSEQTQIQVDRAESADTALALVLVSPDFQRR